MTGINREALEADYLSGMKYKEIAEKYGVTINTVKSWKQRYGWRRESEPHTKKECIQKAHTKKNARTQKKRVHTDIAFIAPELPEAEELTEKERLFCEVFDRNHNATQAYAKVYQCSYMSAAVGANRLLKKDKIKDYLAALRQYRKEALQLEPEHIVERMMKIAFADLGDYITFGRREVEVFGPFGPITVKDEDGEEKTLTKEVNYIDLKESDAVDTTIISEISQGRDGVKVKLNDSIKALQWLMDYFEWNKQDKHRLEFERKKLELQERAVKAQESKLKDDIDDSEYGVVELPPVVGDDDV